MPNSKLLPLAIASSMWSPIHHTLPTVSESSPLSPSYCYLKTFASTLAMDQENQINRKKMPVFKGKITETPRRKSLGARLIKGVRKVRKSLAPMDVVAIRSSDRSVERVVQYPIERKDELVVNMDAGLKPLIMEVKTVEVKQENLQSWQFNPNDPRIDDYDKAFDAIDKVESALGGMIKLHQYCYKQFQATGNPIYRDGANFFRNADLYGIYFVHHVPIRMVYMGMISCQEVEPWFRDYYSCRDSDYDQFKLVDQFAEDKSSYFDKIMNELRHEAFDIMNKEMVVMENYCANQYRQSNSLEFGLGVQFWRKASPMHLPRNYQLALIFLNKRKLSYAAIEGWFRMLYTETFWSGARQRDVYRETEQII